MTGNNYWGPGQHFRDSFVMEDPHNLGHYLMFYTAVIDSDSTWMSIGVAKSIGTDPRRWQDIGPLYITDWYHTRDNKVESPHAFLHVNTFTHGVLGDSTWYLVFSEDSHGDNPTIHVWTHADSLMSNVVDTTETVTPAGWNALSFLQASAPDGSMDAWHGSEYLKVARSEFLAGFNWGTEANADSNAIWIRQMNWGPGSDRDAFTVMDATVVSASGEGLRQVGRQLTLASRNPAREQVAFGIQLHAAARTRLDVLDVLGRRVRTLVNGDFRAGRNVVHWDGRDGGGAVAGSGVYFARLTIGGRTEVTRFVLLR